MVVVHSNDDNDVLPFRAGAACIKCLLTLIGSDIKCTFRLGVCSISAFCVFLVGPMSTLLNQCVLCFFSRSYEYYLQTIKN